jgi:hypothetical protein
MPVSSHDSIQTTGAASALPADPAQRRLRDRYIAARFRQFLQPTDALRDTTVIMRCARQLLDDDHPRVAAELLQLALEEKPSQRPLWLCLIELAYIGNDAAAFSELSDSFRHLFPDAEALPVIDAMGNKLLPSDPRFSHALSPVILPDWSTPESEMRDELRQQKLHKALIDAMAFHLSR